MDRMRFESPDMTAATIDKLAKLFPGVVTEGKVNFDLLRSLLGDEIHSDEAYEFTWMGKRAAIAEAGRPIRKTLRPCVEESKNWDTTENLYIEGDNLDVLKLLQESYLGKVKMIYIDPPYNTGNDFIYRDNFKRSKDEYDAEAGVWDENGDRLFRNTASNGRFHSDWCSMMYPRLVLARNLLSDDGVIFVSLDSNEDCNLRKLLNEIFGEENYVNALHVSRAAKNLNSQFKEIQSLNVGIEYIFVYRKSKDFIWINPYKNASNQRQMGYWTSFYNNADRPTMRYEILGVNIQDGQWKWEKKRAFTAIENFKEFQNQYCYTEEKEEILLLKEYWKDTGSCKEFIKLRNGRPYYWVWPSEFQLRTSDWTDLYINDNEGKRKYGFDTAKNLNTIKAVINAAAGTGDIVLDFFSGSATTAHAVMQLNAEDGGNRKFIMGQLPEPCASDSEAAKAGYKNICEIGKERIRRAGEKIKEEAGLTAQNLDIGFRVLKLDSTNMQDVYYAAGEYTQGILSLVEDNIKDDRTGMDLLFACLLDWGLPLSMPHIQEEINGFTVHTYNEGDLIACFDKHISNAVVREIAKRRPLRAVFRDSSFSSSPEKINVEEIFKLLAPNTSVKVL